MAFANMGSLQTIKKPAITAMGQTGAPLAAGKGLANQVASPASTNALTRTPGMPGSAATAPAAPGMPTVQASNVDLSGANSSFDAQRQQFQQANDKSTAYAAWQNQMRQGAATNSAARAGLAAGGASYLAGARQAQLTSQNNMNNVYSQNATNMGNSFGQQAGVQANAAGTNANLAQQANTFNTGNQITLDKAKADAQSTASANALTADVANYHTNYDYLFDQKGEKAGKAQYTVLLNNYSSAVPGSPEAAAAKQALDAYIAPIQHQRELAHQSQAQVKAKLP